MYQVVLLNLCQNPLTARKYNMHNSKNSYFNTLLLNEDNEDTLDNVMPLLSFDEEDSADDEALNGLDHLPILPLKNAVLFPGVVLPVTVTRSRAIKLIKQVYKESRYLGVIAQQNPQLEDEPNAKDLYQVGTIGYILKMLVLPDDNITVILQGKNRFEVAKFYDEGKFIEADIEALSEQFPAKSNKQNKALMRSLKESALKILKLNPEIPQEAQIAIENIENLNFLTHFLASNVNAETSEKQDILETDDGTERATKLLGLMMRDIQLLEIKQDIQNKVNSDIDQQQRDYFLRQQIRVLQEELGDGVSADEELASLREKARKKKWPREVALHFEKELDKVQRMSPMSAEYPVAINYVELLVELPWNQYTEDNFDLDRAKKILDKDHYGLEKVKERIIEYLAVLKLKNDLRGPILCLYGPPGVGKTSLGRSIATALGRKYTRLSLGGLHDEAEIRGHRKTYIGAMPGKLIQNIKRAQSSNPVFILDEIDKVSSDMRGDPASALLEVLDPEQNNSFMDNYLDLPYDLSKVLFIATANSLDTIHPALRDRMEIIEVTGYTLEEKIEIAKKHLIPKQRKEHGLHPKDVKIDNKAIRKVIEGYTRESGVRNLERQMGALLRKAAKSIVMGEKYEKTIREKDVPVLLGAEIFDKEIYETETVAGIVTGLAWTPVGGEILVIESNLSRGKGRLITSGYLGEVMKESATTALSFLKSIAEELSIDYRVFEHFDLHIHVPAGAVPKDGPSAGITILVSLASVFTQRKIKERLAMTGEITLRGRVLPVGGIKEKILAARRAGITEIILCSKNKRDIEEINADYLKELTIHYVDYAHEVLEIALLPEKVQKTINLSIIEPNAALSKTE
jgi:ATP-dependent Lon protease